MINNWHSQINKVFKRNKFAKESRVPKPILELIRTIFPPSLDAQRTHITMDFLKKTKEILK